MATADRPGHRIRNSATERSESGGGAVVYIFSTKAGSVIGRKADHRQFREEPTDVSSEHMISLQKAADRMGVHYMTVYRYIRTGRISAVKESDAPGRPVECSIAWRAMSGRLATGRVGTRRRRGTVGGPP
jgi:hypothetical protein